MRNTKKILFFVIVISNLLSGLTTAAHAEIVTWVMWWNYWRFTPARYETKPLKDPAWEKIKDPFSWEQTINSITINSAILPIYDFRWNIIQLRKDCKNSKEYKEIPSYCDDYGVTDKTVKQFLSDYSITGTKSPEKLNLPLRVLVEWMNAKKSEADVYDGWYSHSSIFTHWQWGDLIGTYRLSDGSVMWVQKLYGWDNPGYYIFRIKISSAQIIFQQTELIPYINLYAWVDQSKMISFLKTFDTSVKTAISKWFSFKNENFKKRIHAISAYFKSQERMLSKKMEDSSLSKTYKIENNIVKFLSTWYGDQQWLATDIDPNSVKIFDIGIAGVDKYGPFVEWMRLLWWDATLYTLSKDSASYWGKTWSQLVYTYSNNDNGELTVILNASTQTLQFKQTNFSSKESLCKARDNSYYSYDAYDSQYCYGKPDNQSWAEILGDRK
jgi:hypothetical protein